MRRIGSAFLAGVLAGAMFAADFAEAATCFTLQAELEHLQSQSGRGDRRRYDRAFREQANVIARTEGRARRAGCFGGGFFMFGRSSDRSCRVLVSKLRDMQANLGRLDQMRRRGGGGNGPRIRQIQAAMAARSCGVPGRDNWQEARRAERLPGEEAVRYSRRGTYRTLCVRTCDGYYFPISFATTREQFGNDAQTCSAMCPGAEAELFYHPNPGGGPEDMISLADRPYNELSTAFQYRTNLAPSCSCKPAGGYSEIATNPIGDVSEQPVSAAPEPAPALIPRPRPAPDEDPETLANRAGGLVPGSAAAGGATVADAFTSDGRPVRIVGPAYWGVQEQEELVLTPVPN